MKSWKKLVFASQALLISFFIPFAASADEGDVCSPIATSPSIYQINRTDDTATLYINPVDGASSYTIMYGFSSGDERFSATFDYGATTGAITYTVNGLEKGKTYYYEIQAVNACSRGPFSDWVPDSKASTTSSGSTLLEAGSGTVITATLLGGFAVLFGLVLFAL